MRRRGWAGWVALLLVAGLVVAGCDQSPSAEPPRTPTAQKTTLTFGVFGEPDEVDGFRSMVAAYNAQAVSTHVDLVTWPDREALVADIALGKKLPDLFMLARRDLARVLEGDLNEPLFELLDERGLSYGDRFSRDAIEAFSADNDLQCMPYSISPMVMYYNTDLIDFDKLAARGLPVPNDDGEWSFEGFRAAAQVASRPRRGTSGVYVPPTLRGLAPFIYSGGGQVFDDDTDPTSLALGEDDDVTALRTTLEVLRDPALTLSDSQLARATPEEWFERGKLGMVEGFRSLTPELRQVPGLHFDVVAMPTIDDPATIGELTGLCISSQGRVNATADFLVFALSDESFASVTDSGYIVPANAAVARSDDFLQPERQPQHAGVFNASIDTMEQLPVIRDSTKLNAAVEPLLQDLLTVPVIDDTNSLEDLTAQIDEASRRVLDPDYVPPTDPSSEAPSGSPDASPPTTSDSSTSDSSP